MTKRSLPRLESTLYRDDRPAAEATILLPSGPPSEDAAFGVLVRFVPEVEARRLQRTFGRVVIEPRRLERLGIPTQVDEISGQQVMDFLEATWLADQDAAMGIPQPHRWKR